MSWCPWTPWSPCPGTARPRTSSRPSPPPASPASRSWAGETRDGPIVISGYVHLKDILYATEAQRSEPIPSWHARALVPVHAGDEVEDVLAAMQRTGAHLGRVEDPEGVTIGVVFLEDILEELIGEVHDAMQRG